MSNIRLASRHLLRFFLWTPFRGTQHTHRQPSVEPRRRPICASLPVTFLRDATALACPWLRGQRSPLSSADVNVAYLSYSPDRKLSVETGKVYKIVTRLHQTKYPGK